MKCLIITIVIQLIIILYLVFGINKSPTNYIVNKQLLNMANTVSPIIQQISERLGEYENVQTAQPALGGDLIYKREKIDPFENGGSGCINNYGNVYYIRVHEWGWEENKVWYKPIKDVPLGCFSCIDEKDVFIPYWNEELQNAKIGEKFYR